MGPKRAEENSFLPTGWKSKVAKSGDTFYYNKSKGEKTQKQWECPEGTRYFLACFDQYCVYRKNGTYYSTHSPEPKSECPHCYQSMQFAALPPAKFSRLMDFEQNATGM